MLARVGQVPDERPYEAVRVVVVRQPAGVAEIEWVYESTVFRVVIGRGVVDVLRKRVAAQNAEPAVESLVQRQLQRVVVLAEPVHHRVNVFVFVPRPPVVDRALILAQRFGKVVDRCVLVVADFQVRRFGAHVADPQQPVGGEFSLYGEIPALHILAGRIRVVPGCCCGINCP